MGCLSHRQKGSCLGQQNSSTTGLHKWLQLEERGQPFPTDALKPHRNGTACYKTPHGQWWESKEGAEFSFYLPILAEAELRQDCSNIQPSLSPDFPYICVSACINCSRPVSGSFCEPREVLCLATELCHQPKTSSLVVERGEREEKRKKGKASGQTIDYSFELQGAIDFSLNTMYCCKAEKK